MNTVQYYIKHTHSIHTLILLVLIILTYHESYAHPLCNLGNLNGKCCAKTNPSPKCCLRDVGSSSTCYQRDDTIFDCNACNGKAASPSNTTGSTALSDIFSKEKVEDVDFELKSTPKSRTQQSGSTAAPVDSSLRTINSPRTLVTDGSDPLSQPIRRDSTFDSSAVDTRTPITTISADRNTAETSLDGHPTTIVTGERAETSFGGSRTTTTRNPVISNPTTEDTAHGIEPGSIPMTALSSKKSGSTSMAPHSLSPPPVQSLPSMGNTTGTTTTPTTAANGAPATTPGQGAAGAGNPPALPPPQQAYDYKDKLGDGECAVSDQIDGSKYGCSSKRNIISGAEISNQTTQMAASLTTQAMGQQAQLTMMRNSTDPTAGYQATADLQKRTGITETTAGGVNMIWGIAQIAAARKAGKHATELSEAQNAKIQDTSKATNPAFIGPSNNEAIGKGATVANTILDSFELKTGVTETVAQQQNKKIAKAAAAEQRKIAEAAKIGAFKSILTGSQQVMTGGFQIAAAKALEDSIKNMKTGNNTTPTLTPITPPGLPNSPTGPNGFAGPGVISGSGANPNQAAAEEDNPAPLEAPPDLGPGINSTPLGSNLPDGPAPGKLSMNGAQPGGGGGGGGDAGGGGSTSAAGAAPDEPQAKSAGNGEGATYDSGGAFIGGGGSGGGKGSDGGGMDLSALAQLLPKQKEEESKASTSILDFNRNIANDSGPAFSLLGRDVNIFKRVEETYSYAQQHRRVGAH